MGSRGRERLVTCSSCGRSVPRDKAVVYSRGVAYSTELRGQEGDIRFFERRKMQYCPSCGKHLRIYEKKKKAMMRKYNL